MVDHFSLDILRRLSESERCDLVSAFISVGEQLLSTTTPWYIHIVRNAIDYDVRKELYWHLLRSGYSVEEVDSVYGVVIAKIVPEKDRPICPLESFPISPSEVRSKMNINKFLNLSDTSSYKLKMLGILAMMGVFKLQALKGKKQYISTNPMFDFGLPLETIGQIAETFRTYGLKVTFCKNYFKASWK